MDTDAPAPRERPRKKRPSTKHIYPVNLSLSPFVLKVLHESMENPRRRGPWPPLASPTFLQRVTIRLKTIVRRSDGQLMLAVLISPLSPQLVRDAVPGSWRCPI